jgi:hypothetical protein
MNAISASMIAISALAGSTEFAFSAVVRDF